MATLKISSDLQNVIKKVVLDAFYPVGKVYISVSYGGASAGLWAYSASQWIGGSEINEMVETGDSGGNQPHDHTLPAYPAPTVVLNVWKRVA